MSVRIDREGIIAMLQSSGVQRAVDSAAKSMAGKVNATAHDGPAPVTVDRFKAPYGDGRGVTIAHPGGVALEAKHQYLANAAAAAGLSPGKGRR